MSETSILDAIKGLTAQFHELRAEVSDLRNQSKGVGCPDDMDDPESCPDDTDDDSPPRADDEDDMGRKLEMYKGYILNDHDHHENMCDRGLNHRQMKIEDLERKIAQADETSDDNDDDSDDDQDDSDGNQIAVTRSALPWDAFKALLLEECEQEDSFGYEREGFYGNISHHHREEATDDPSNLEEAIDAVALFINLGVLPVADRFAKYE